MRLSMSIPSGRRWPLALSILVLCLICNRVDGAPFSSNLSLPSSILSAALTVLQPLNLTVSDPRMAKYEPPDRLMLYHQNYWWIVRDIWPAMPFKFRRSSTDPEWLHFFYGGPSFGKIQGISLGWDLGALLLKLSELDESRPCPPYEAQKGSSFIKLEPRPHFLLTVGHCIRAIATFDHLLERWGYR